MLHNYIIAVSTQDSVNAHLDKKLIQRSFNILLYEDKFRNCYYDLSFENSSVIEYDVIICHSIFIGCRVLQIPLRINRNLEYFKELGNFKI